MFNKRLPKIVLFVMQWENYGRVGQDTDGNVIWRMRFACWINKAANTHSEYLILIDFPLQQ
jgi:hypothetical protein